MANPFVVVLAGPTAVGKTEIALDLAEALTAEVVSADSMQVYRGMNIGTAKPTTADRQRVPHHMIDLISPDEPFNAADYAGRAAPILDALLETGKTPLVVGGTGLYIRALMDGFLFPDQGSDDALRAELLQRWQNNAAALHRELAAVDPEAAGRVHPNDSRRVIRALEVYYRTGEPLSRLQERGRGKKPGYSGLWFGLTRQRSDLYARIEQRIDWMFQQGLVEEVAKLRQQHSHQPTALQALGYKEIVWYLERKISLDEAVYLLKRDTRRYAKRQLSWFRKDERIHWFNLSTCAVQSVVEEIAMICRKQRQPRGS